MIRNEVWNEDDALSRGFDPPFSEDRGVKYAPVTTLLTALNGLPEAI
jgi:hypothetical protein